MVNQKRMPLMTLLILTIVMASSNHIPAATLTVDCAKGETITKAVERAKPGDTIQVTGTCKETVTITTDRLTLDGQGSAILDGGSVGKEGAVVFPSQSDLAYLPFYAGVLTIAGARGVTITGFTIQHGLDGITCKGGATCIVRNTTLQDNADEGIQVSQNATAEVVDCTLRRNAEWGILVFDTSSVIFHGTLVTTNNGRDGINIDSNSTARVYGGTTIQANNNAGNGITLGMISTMSTERSTINVEHNAGHGVHVRGGSSLWYGGSTFIVKHNKRAGLRVDDGSIVYMHKSIFTDNSTDVALSFGAHATLKGNTIGTITCDKNSMIRGDITCPE